MDEWGISGNYKKLEAIFIEYLMAEFRSIPIPKGHICKFRNPCFKNMIFRTNIHLIYTKKLYKNDFNNIVWQEVFDNGVRLDRNITIIEVWKNFGNGWKDELRKVSMAHGVYCYPNRQN